MSEAPPRWDAIIVAGGRASRLGGIDKTALVYDGRSLLRRSIDAVSGADTVSIVGHDGSLGDDVSPRLLRTEERPRWGGPAAAIVAGLQSLSGSEAEFTAVLAGDLPQAAGAVAILVDELAGSVGDGLVAIDSAAHSQPLLAIYRTSSLRAAAAGIPSATNLSVRQLIGSLSLREVSVPDELCVDVDTPEDAAELGIRLPPTPLG